MDNFSEWLPPYVRLPFLTPEEVALFRERVDERLFRPAQVVSPEGERGVVTDHCDCAIQTIRAGTPYYLTTQALLRNWETITGRYKFDLYERSLGSFPGINVLRYEVSRKGQQPGFKPHVDVGGDPLASKRKLTLVVLLNDPSEYVGGDLIVDVGKRYNTTFEAKVGDLIVFPSFTMHSVEPIIAGRRDVAVGWLHGPPFR